MTSSPDQPDPRVAADEDSGGAPPVLVPEAQPKRPQPSFRRSVIEWVAVIVGAIVIALLIKTFLFQPFYIPSASMEPTLQEGDRVLVNKLSYKAHPVHRGDVVVFSRPPTEAATNVHDLIKRVIGLPGETLTLRDGRVMINGQAIPEPYVKKDPVTGLPEPTNSICGFPSFPDVPGATAVGAASVRIPKGYVFVMGDNRTNSQDSRCFGPINENLIVGRAFVRMWPPSRLGWL